MRLRGSWLWVSLLPAACLVYPWIVHAFIVDTKTLSLRMALAVLNGVPHAAVNLFLMWVFGRTLLQRREPLITGLARRVHGTLAPEIESYTRRITAAWCLFFATQVLLSLTLLAVAPLDVWSLFVNVLSLPLIALMFAAEYLYRILRFPDHAHVSIWQGVHAFIRHARGERPPEVRSQN